MPPISGVPFLAVVIDRDAVAFEVSAQLVGLGEVPCSAHLLSVKQQVEDLAQRQRGCRSGGRGGGRGPLHQDRGIMVLLPAKGGLGAVSAAALTVLYARRRAAPTPARRAGQGERDKLRRAARGHVRVVVGRGGGPNVRSSGSRARPWAVQLLV